jgi:FkbM family methyltransferase
MYAVDMLKSLTVWAYKKFPSYWPFPKGKGIAARCLLAAARMGVLKPDWVEKDGFWLWTNIEDFNQREITIGAFDETVLQTTIASLYEGNVFLDIGANVGYLSLIASRCVGSHGRVLAFEPNPFTVKILRKNVERNGARNIAIQQMACCNYSGSTKFFTGTGRHSGLASLSSENAGGTISVNVKCCSIDEVVAEERLHNVHLIKTDTEGAELSVMLGAQNTIRRFRPKVLVEIEESKLSAFKTKPAEIFRLFEQWKYSGMPVGRTNWLFLPR